MIRATSQLVVSALVRGLHQAGGSAMILARGDASAGAILLVLLDRGSDPRLFERGYGPDGRVALLPVNITAYTDEAITDYWQRRRSRDPDLWVVELDGADVERFAAETIAMG